MGQLVDRTGIRYGKLVVLNRDASAGAASNGKRTRWVCLCDCGNTTSKTGHELASGDSKSCGCLQRELAGNMNRSHGMARTPTYRSWQAMKERCYNEANTHYLAYGGKGITVCDRWLASFENFLADMGTRPKGMTLDRIKNEVGYTPGNCRWATAETQANNRSTNVVWQGVSMSIKQLAAHINVPRTSLNKLLVRGMPLDEAVHHAVSHRK
jgi:hypothetical protein